MDPGDHAGLHLARQVRPLGPHVDHAQPKGVARVRAAAVTVSMIASLGNRLGPVDLSPEPVGLSDVDLLLDAEREGFDTTSSETYAATKRQPGQLHVRQPTNALEALATQPRERESSRSLTHR